MSNIIESIVVNAGIARAFDVIANVADYPKFVPEILAVTIERKSATSITATFKINLIVTSEYTLKFTLKKPKKIIWELVKGNHIESNNGSWILEPINKSKTRLIYSVDMEFGWLVPKSVITTLIESHLPKMLKNFKKQIEK